MSEFNLEDLDFKDKEVRKKFVNNTESGIYGGKSTDGVDVVVMVQKGEELSVKWENGKGWYEGIVYDNEGERTDEILKKI